MFLVVVLAAGVWILWPDPYKDEPDLPEDEG